MKTVFVLLLLSVGAAAEDSNRALTDSLEERAANAKAARMTTDQRIEFYRSLAAAHPDRQRYKILLAATFLQKMRETTDFGYVDRSSRILDEVLATEPANYTALSLRAQVALEYHQFAKAAEIARRLLTKQPRDPLNWGALADALTEMGDYDSAGDAIQKMVDLRPDLASYNRAAHFRFLNGDAAGAIDIMKRAIESGSSSPENVAWCSVELGDIYFKTGRIEEARAAYRQGLQSFPGSHKAWASLGRLQLATREYDAAAASYRRAQAMVPMPDYAAALYDIYTAMGDKASAAKQRDSFDLIDRLAIANKETANRNVSLILSDHSWNPPRALKLAQAELNVRRDVYTYDALAWALYRNGDFASAEEAIAKALKLNTPEPQFYLHSALIAQMLGKTQAAAQAMERAAALNPLWPGLRERHLINNKTAALE